MWKEAKLLRKEYVHGSGGCRAMVYRPAGTVVAMEDGGEFTTEESVVVVGWEQHPTYDSGYATEEFVATPSGIKAAHRYMDSFM